MVRVLSTFAILNMTKSIHSTSLPFVSINGRHCHTFFPISRKKRCTLEIGKEDDSAFLCVLIETGSNKVESTLNV